jgi:hypothetical protein
MTADAIPDRRVTVPAPGFDPAFVDWSRLHWAFPSPMHEGFWCRASRPTGYKVMRCFPHLAYGPVQDRQRRTAYCATLRPRPRYSCTCSLPSRRGLSTVESVVRTPRRPALTAAARGASETLAGRDEETAPGRTKKRAKERKKERKSWLWVRDSHSIGACGTRSLLPDRSFLLTYPIQGAGFKPALARHMPVGKVFPV